MRTTSKLFMAGLIALGMISCNKEEGSINGENQEQIYMQLSIEMPQTKSATDGAGDSNSDADVDIEEGTTAESLIKTVKMYLLNPEDKTVVAESINEKPLVKAGSMVTVGFQAQDLVNYVKGGTNPKNEIEAIIYVNSTPAAGFNVDEKCNVASIDAITSSANGFWMTNANRDHITTTLPELAVLLTHKTEENPFIINPLDVERTAARFDVAARNNTFPVMQGQGEEAKATLNVVMDEVALVNMSNDFYRLRRVSADGTNPNFKEMASWENLFGIETPANYVVDAEPETFSFTEKEELQWTSLASLATDGNADNWTDNMNGDPKPEYYKWCYATENTSKLGKGAQQDQTTAVSYKGHIASNDQTDPELATEITTGTETLYTLNNVLWGSWTRIAAQAGRTDKKDQALVDAYKFAMNLINDVNWKPELKENARIEAAAKDAGFIAYHPTNGKYEVYYMYYNRHNNKVSTGSEDKMAMKYGVVRNNVYKLNVSKVNLLGTPDWVKPEPKPIEEENVYFQVTVTILPWTVRINDIEF